MALLSLTRNWWRRPARKAYRRPDDDRSTARLGLEVLEGRAMPSVTVGPNVNISHMPGNQHESTVSVDPASPRHLFAASNLEQAGIFASYSTDGGLPGRDGS